MAEAFDSFNAPQFVDFSRAPDYLDETLEAYFDVDHENTHQEKNSTISEKEYSRNMFYSPIEDTLPDSTTVSTDPLDTPEEQHEEYKTQTYKLRKSMSVGNLVLFDEENYLETIGDAMKNLNVSHNGVGTSETFESNQLHKTKVPCRSSSASTSRGRITQAHINKLAQPKQYTSVENLNNGKFVSLAEAVNKFQNRTPARFRSKPNLAHNHSSQNHSSQTLFRTVPESPALHTKARSRPANILSSEEREQMEFDNLQKFKIKANPLNKKILQGPLKPKVPVEKKPSTKLEPFNLTLVATKKVMPSPPKYQFHARPVPRSTEKAKKPQEIEKQRSTQPKTPSFMKNYKIRSQKSEEELTRHDASQNHKSDFVNRKPTKPKPFSFENRDKMVYKKREDFINKIKEEERRAREFHARPVPKSVYKRNDSIKSDSGSSRTSSRRQDSHENLSTQFKARPPTVLHKEPFIPAKSAKPLTEIKPFDLNTELRSSDREEFARAKKEREERLEYLRKLDEEEMKRREQEEITNLRKQAEYKANPVRKYKEVKVQPSNKITVPISPNFHSRIVHKNQDKENIPNNSS